MGGSSIGVGGIGIGVDVGIRGVGDGGGSGTVLWIVKVVLLLLMEGDNGLIRVLNRGVRIRGEGRCVEELGVSGTGTGWWVIVVGEFGVKVGAFGGVVGG